LAFSGLQHCFETLGSLPLVALSAKLNLEKIKMYFALDQTATEFAGQGNVT
jgi:hypothetical protein